MKSLYFALLFLLFLTPIALAAQVVEVNKPAEEQKSGFMSGAWGFLKSPLFWGIVLTIILLFAIAIGIIFLIRWIIGFFKAQNDIFYKIKREKISLAKAHARYNGRHWWRITKNVPIHLVRIENGKPVITNPIGYHRGDYTTHEGSEIIAISIPNRKKLMILPDTDLLIIPNREKITIETADQTGKKTSQTIEGLPMANKLVQFNHNQILVYADSLSSSGSFLFPVLKTEGGKIVDLSLPVYSMLKEVALGEYLFQQSDDYVKAARRAVDMNPSIRGAQKLTDSNQGLDVNTQENNP